MIQTSERAQRLTSDLMKIRAERFELRRGIRSAALVVAPLAVGFALGYIELSVLFTLGALNLLLVEAPAPTLTRWRALGLGTVANTLAFGAGTLLSHAPIDIEVPLAGVGIFVAFLFTRWPEWENVGFIAAVMFVFSLGIPVTNLTGEILRPFAILSGGLWALFGVSLYRALTQPPFGRVRSKGGTPEPPAPPVRWRAAAPHAAIVGGTVAVGLLLGSQLGLARDYWIMLTIIVALRLDLATTVAYSSARILGTVAGASVAFVITDATQDPWILFPVLAAVTAMCFATRSVNYTLYAMWITLTVIVLLNLAYSGGPALAITRVVDTLIGGSLALLAAFTLWLTVHRPRGARAPPA